MTLLRAISLRSRSLRLASVAALGLVAPTTNAEAETYPVKPIRIISPFSAGSAPDVLGRLIADRLSKQLGRSVTIENRPGGGTTLATKAGAVADADGYTLLQANAAFVYGAVIYPGTGYDPLRSFSPVAMVGSWSHLLLASPSVRANTLQELVAEAKASPGQVNIGFPLGSPPHVLAEILKTASAAPFNSVPYRQVPQLISDLLSGRISVFFGAGAGPDLLVRQQKLKALAYTGRKRYTPLPDVPTVVEAGLPQLALDPSDWTGIVAPAGTPPQIIAVLNRAINESLTSPQIETSIAQQGGTAKILSPQEFSEFLAAESNKWPPLVNAAGMVSN